MSCSAPDQGNVQLGTLPPASVAGTVIEGLVLSDGTPFEGAYVRLLDRSGEFVAEVVSGAAGQYRFHAAEGEWTVRALAPGAGATSPVAAAPGLNRVDLALTPAS